VLKLGSPLGISVATLCSIAPRVRARVRVRAATAAQRSSLAVGRTVSPIGLSPFGFSVGARPPPLSFLPIAARRDRLPAGVQRGGDGEARVP
jgi:hypothetical protein